MKPHPVKPHCEAVCDDVLLSFLDIDCFDCIFILTTSVSAYCSVHIVVSFIVYTIFHIDI